MIFHIYIYIYIYIYEYIWKTRRHLFIYIHLYIIFVESCLYSEVLNIECRVQDTSEM